MSKTNNKTTAIDRLNEERIYELVANEIKNNIRKDGLWAKAIAKSSGDIKIAQSTYIKLRVQQIKDEEEILHDIAEQKAKEDKRDKLREKISETKSFIGNFINWFLIIVMVIIIILLNTND